MVKDIEEFTSATKDLAATGKEQNGTVEEATIAVEGITKNIQRVLKRS